MATKRHKPEEIVTQLRQVEVLVGHEMARVDAIREMRINCPPSNPVIGLGWQRLGRRGSSIVILRGAPEIEQALLFQCSFLDFSLFLQNAFEAAEVDIGRCEIAEWFKLNPDGVKAFKRRKFQ